MGACSCDALPPSPVITDGAPGAHSSPSACELARRGRPAASHIGPGGLMRVLALDTATEACSVALLTERAARTLRAESAAGTREQILGMVDAVLAEAACRSPASSASPPASARARSPA